MSFKDWWKAKWAAVKAAVKKATVAVGKFLADLVTNVKGWGDAYKILGVAFAVVGLVCVTRPVGAVSVEVFLAIEGVAGGLMGISLVGDHQAIKSGDPARYQ